MRFSIEPRDRIYVKGNGFLSFTENTEFDKNGQNLLDNTKN